jgi:glycosyltransferase involved in cell wall biosynthesis
MNILFVADVSIHKVIGGAERVLFEQCTHLSRRGHGVHVLTRRLPEHKGDQEKIEGVQEWRYTVDTSSAFTFLMSTARCGGALFESLHRKYAFDCINFHQPFSSSAIIRASGSRSVPKIYTCHSLSFEEYLTRNRKPKNIVSLPVYLFNVLTRKYIERKVLSACGQIIVLSHFTADKLERVYPIHRERIHVIPGGVDLTRFAPALDKVIIRERLGMPRNRMVLLTIRNLVPRMGLENLVRAMSTVCRDVPDSFLVIGGEGPLKDELRALAKNLGIEDRIAFAGFIPEEELPDYYRMADLFLLPTRALEGFGLVTVEALASGTPVLGTPVGGTLEILGAFDSEFIFRDSEADSIAELIGRMCRRIKEDPAYLPALSLQCRLFAEGHYNWEKNVDQLERLFLQVVSERAV